MVSDIASKTAGGRHIAYVSLQAVVEGQDTWAAVNEIVRCIEASGWSVDVYFPDYGGRSNPDVVSRLTQMNAIRRRIAPHIAQYDALYVRAHPLAYQISALARRRGIPVVQECNGPYEDLFIAHPAARIARAFFERLQRSQYRNASAIISVAKGLTEWLVADTGNHNVTTNPNGANIDVFTPDAPKRAGLPERYAVFFGQFATWQGIGTLLDAVRHPSWPADLPLVFVGDGAMRPAVQRAAREMPDRVVYVGKVLYEEVATVVAHAIASFAPLVVTDGELIHSPLKLYEAMACGVPVIASDTVGISEVIERHQCGLLVAPGDAAGFAEATARLAAEPDLAREMGRRGREAVVESYSWRARAIQRRDVVEAAIVEAQRDRERRAQSV